MRILLALTAWLFSVAVVADGVNIAVSAEQRAALGIETAEVASVAEAPMAALPATVKLPGDSTRAVVVPLGGTVIQLPAQQGKIVTRGEPLLQVRSRDYLEVAADLAVAQAELTSLSAQVDRDRKLVAEGIAPARRRIESEALLRAAQARSSSYQSLLTLVRPVANAPGEYQLLAPGDGVLIEAGLAPGDSVTGESVAFFILDSEKVWLEAQVPERLIERISAGYRAEAGDPPRSGRVLSIGRVIDPHTRSALLRAELPAGPGLRPGQSTEMIVFGPVAPGTVLVPARALVRLDGQDTVFRATESGFVAVPVKSGLRTPNGVAVTGDGLAGARIAVAGLSALKALAQGS